VSIKFCDPALDLEIGVVEDRRFTFFFSAIVSWTEVCGAVVLASYDI
jgi:hypothetical protein